MIRDRRLLEFQKSEVGNSDVRREHAKAFGVSNHQSRINDQSSKVRTTRLNWCSGQAEPLSQPERRMSLSRGLHAIRDSRIASQAAESQVYRDQFLASIKDRLGTAAVKGQAMDLCQELFLADGALSDEEDEVLQNLRELLQ